MANVEVTYGKKKIVWKKFFNLILSDKLYEIINDRRIVQGVTITAYNKVLMIARWNFVSVKTNWNELKENSPFEFCNANINELKIGYITNKPIKSIAGKMYI
ncbi:MAG: hypothetical protein ACRC5R_02010 [Mycoplasmatales bacterium]